MSYQPRVMLVEDDPDTLQVYQIACQNLRCRISTASTGNEAWQSYEQAIREGDPFALIVLDVMLRSGDNGPMSGKRVAELIRESGDNTVKIVFLTGMEREQAAMIGGYNNAEVWHKPFGAVKLPQEIMRILNLPQDVPVERRTNERGETTKPNFYLRQKHFAVGCAVLMCLFGVMFLSRWHANQVVPTEHGITLHCVVPNLKTRFTPSGPRRPARITFDVDADDEAVARQLCDPPGTKLTLTVH